MRKPSGEELMFAGWWTVSCVISCTVGGAESHLEEDVILVDADTKRAAMEKAQMICLEKEKPYLNSDGKQVQWKFVEVLSAYNVWDEWKDGMEIFGRLLN